MHLSYQLAVVTKICRRCLYAAYRDGLTYVCKYISHSGQCLLSAGWCLASRGKFTTNIRSAELCATLEDERRFWPLNISRGQEVNWWRQHTLGFMLRILHRTTLVDV